MPWSRPRAAGQVAGREPEPVHKSHENTKRTRREHEGNTKRIRRQHPSLALASPWYPACAWLAVRVRKRGGRGDLALFSDSWRLATATLPGLPPIAKLRRAADTACRWPPQGRRKSWTRG